MKITVRAWRLLVAGSSPARRLRSADFPVCGLWGLSSPHSQPTELESSVNPQTGKSALRGGKRGRALVCSFAALCSLLANGLTAAPLSSAFSYQGRLLENGVPANGRYDLQFSLFTMETGGSPSTAPVTNAEVTVSNGVFTTLLDFGRDVFSGTTCWLEISVRPAGPSGNFVTLSPRQLLSPTPYAIYTLKA